MLNINEIAASFLLNNIVKSTSLKQYSNSICLCLCEKDMLAALLQYFHLTETIDPSLIQFTALIAHSHTLSHSNTQRTFVQITHTLAHTHHEMLRCTYTNT